MSTAMSKRIDKSWIVLASLENEEHDRCIDLFRRPDGSHGFEEFRRDPEDAGARTPVSYYAYVSPPKRKRWPRLRETSLG